MDTPQLGKLLYDKHQRDAIHIAICPVVAAERLSPGQEIGFVNASEMLVGSSSTPVGIVDPFLPKLVFPEQRFWMVMFPGSTTPVRHEWTHPALAGNEPDEDTDFDDSYDDDYTDECRGCN